MIYLLYGPDEFRIHERVQLIQKEHGSPISGAWAQGDQVDTQKLGQIFSAQSLLASQPVLVLQNFLADGSIVAQRWLDQWLKNEADTNAIEVIFVEAALPIKKSLWSPYLSQWQVEAFALFSPAEATAWLKKIAEQRQLHLVPSAVQQLVTNFGNDLWRLSNELDKLAAFALQSPIDPTTLQLLIVPVLPDNIFQAIDALARKDFRTANHALNTQLAIGTTEGELLTMMAYQFRNIAIVKTLTETKLTIDKLIVQTKLHPYVVKKSLSFARIFTWPQLQRIFYLLQKVDTAIKQSQTPPRAGLDILVAQIVSC